jgi:Bacterial SH3 domain
MGKVLTLAACLLALNVAAHAQTATSSRRFDRESGQYAEVTVTDPYLEFRLGPGMRYPIFYVVPRGQRVQILFRRTDWFRVRDDRDHEGWVHRDAMGLTLLATGDNLPLEDARRRETDTWPWELGAESGRWGGGHITSVRLGYALTANLTPQVELAQAIGQAYDRQFFLVGIAHTFVPAWRIAPFLEIGGGVSKIHPNAAYTGTPGRNLQELAYYGGGLRWAINNKFEFRAEYRSNVVFTKSAQNEDSNEWKAGFAFFF